MSSRVSNTQERQAAILAGLAYVAIIALAFFANFAVIERLVTPDDAAATVSNIVDSEALFRSAIAAWVLVLIADIVVAWGLYVLFQRTSRELSILAAWLRVVNVAITGAALLCLLVVLKLVDATGYTTALAPGQRNSQVMLFLDAYTYGWSIALVIFGFHLLLLGLLIIKSDYAPNVLGALVVVAGLAYVANHLALVLLSNYEDNGNLFTALVVALAVPGEFGLAGWLLWKAGKPRSIHTPQAVKVNAG
jgi:hypothetical protein